MYQTPQMKKVQCGYQETSMAMSLRRISEDFSTTVHTITIIICIFVIDGTGESITVTTTNNDNVGQKFGKTGKIN